MSDIETRLRDTANKWQHANHAVYEVCRDAAEEIRVLRLQRDLATEKTNSIIHAYPHGSGWGKGKDE